jgi:hypothetical protein
MEVLKPFGIENGFFLLDDYLDDDLGYKTLGLCFPSVRHIVLSYKTKDPKIKKQISQTKLPADLKDFELSIETPDYWTPEYIYQKMYSWTLYKFEKNKVLGEKLKAINPKDLKENLEKRYDIEELQKIVPDYRIAILTKVRERLFK